MQTATQTEIPEKLGRFVVLARVTSANGRTLVKAMDAKTGRSVAVLLMSEREAGELMVQRLRHEARAASALRNPHIACLLGGGEWDAGFYIVMEYVDPGRLRDRLAQKPSRRELLGLCRQACIAIDHAASRGIVHRNLTPDNIAITPDGALKILDFGIPKSEPLLANDPARLRYMTPEQLAGKPLDRRANLYSWAAMLYELIAGRPAFPDENVAELRRAVLEQPPAPPHEFNPACNPAVSEVLLKALDKNPNLRLASGTDLLREFESASKQVVRAPTALTTLGLATGSAAPASAPAHVAGAEPAAAPKPPEPVAVAPVPAAAGKQAASAPPVKPASAASVARPWPGSAALKPMIEDVVRRARTLPAKWIAVAASVALISLAAALGYWNSRRVQAAAPAPAAPVMVVQDSARPSEPPPVDLSLSVLVPSAPPNTPRRQPRATAPAPAPEPIIVTGDVVVNSTPAGATVRLDGGAEGWATPVTLTGVAAGQHTIAISKAGYQVQTHNVDISAGNRAILAVTLAELPGVLAIASEPAGASILVDGRETGRTTPSQLGVPKGTHLIVLRKPGYFETSVTAQVEPGQSSSFAPVLKPMGNAESVQDAGGRFKKMFGGAPRDMASVQIRTRPRGARIVLNNRVLDKPTPAEFLLEPGNYELVVSADGYRPLRRSLTLEKGSKLVIDEALAR